jgi:DNA-binding response OmpR family regulator
VRRILVIDDEQMVRDMLEKALGLVHFSVDTAENAFRAIEKIKNNKFDLVITDVNMPSMDGNEVARYIKSKNAGTPIIGVSGSPWMIQDGLFDDVMYKPFSIRALVETVQSLTEMRKAG